MALDRIDDLDHRHFLAQDYAVIDPRQLEAGWWEALGPEPLAPRSIADDPATLPQLICLQNLPEAQRIDLLARSDAWSHECEQPLFCALLQSTAEPQRLVAHLTRHLLLPVPEGGKAWVLYYDPRVFHHLCWQWSTQQLKGLLGPIATWTFFSDGAWRIYTPGDLVVPSQLRLSAEQWQQLDRMELLNRSWKRLRRAAATPPRDDLPVQLDRALAQAVLTEQLKVPEDICFFAEQRASYGPGLHRHPDMARRLNRVRAGECAYSRSCAGLHDADYRRLASDAATSEGTHL